MIPAISVIIPVYNVENFIRRCARSILDQTFDDAEYIFVNDASTDRSIEILNDVIKTVPMVRIAVSKFVLCTERKYDLYD